MSTNGYLQIYTTLTDVTNGRWERDGAYILIIRLALFNTG
jgi:hypothetical protein